MTKKKAPSIEAVASDHVDIWKKVVDVQMHFNDLQLRVRSLAFTVTAAFLALGGYALKDAGAITVFSAHIPLAAVIVFSAVIPVLAFYFMERWWYHPLLMGAVIEGSSLEAKLRKEGVPLDLGGNISRASGIQNWWIGEKRKFTQEDIRKNAILKDKPTVTTEGGFYVKRWWPLRTIKLFTWRTFRSFHKMAVFYWLLVFSLVGVGLALWFAPLRDTDAVTRNKSGGDPPHFTSAVAAPETAAQTGQPHT